MVRRSSLVKLNKDLAFKTLRLTGLDDERRRLREFYSSGQNEPKVAFVSGPSGVGKSALISTLKEAVEADGGFFCVGKQEQLSTQTFQAFSDAMTHLATALYDAEADDILLFSEALSSSMSPDLASILMDSSPEFCALFSYENLMAAGGTRGEDLTYNPEHKQMKVQLAYGELLSFVCTPQRPIVLVIEDMQWADVATLNLLVSLSAIDKISSLTIVGSYRDNEVNESHPLTEAMNQMKADKRSPASFANISLQNLNLASLNQVISHLVETEPSCTLELSRVIMNKTDGNMFFTLQLMAELHQTELVYYDMLEMKWEWDLDVIELEIDIKDNVVDLVCSQLKRLPESVQQGLKIGSCIGSRFHQGMVEGILDTIGTPEGIETSEGNSKHEQRPPSNCPATHSHDADESVSSTTDQNSVTVGASNDERGNGDSSLRGEGEQSVDNSSHSGDNTESRKGIDGGTVSPRDEQKSRDGDDPECVREADSMVSAIHDELKSHDGDDPGNVCDADSVDPTFEDEQRSRDSDEEDNENVCEADSGSPTIEDKPKTTVGDINSSHLESDEINSNHLECDRGAVAEVSVAEDDPKSSVDDSDASCQVVPEQEDDSVTLIPEGIKSQEAGTPDEVEGNSVDLDSSEATGRINFDAAVKAGLICHIPGTCVYRFMHDRIQQAAYQMFESEEEKAIAHKNLGLFLQSQPDMEERPDNMLIVAEQLNLGASQMVTAEERLNVAMVNVEAGERTLKKGAFKQTHIFLEKATNSVPLSTLWKEHIDTAWQLSCMLADVLCTEGEYAGCSATVEDLVAHANTREREMQAREIKMRMFYSRGELKQMVKFGLKFVRKCGIRMPKKAGKLHMIFEFMAIKKLLKKLSEDDILSMPESSDENMHRICSFLVSIGTASFFRDDPNMLFLAHLRTLKLSLLHGACANTSVGIATYGVLLTAMGDFGEAFKVGELAEKMAGRFNIPYIDTFVNVNVNDFLKPLRNPLQQTIDPFLSNFGTGIESGNLAFACSCGALYVCVYYLAGLPLEPLLNDSATIRRHFMNGNENTMRFNLMVNVQTAHSIAGREADPFSFNCIIKEVGKELEDAIEKENVMALLTYWGMKASVFYILDPEDGRTRDTFQELWKLPMELIKIHYFYIIISFYSGMAAMTFYRKTKKKKHKKKYRRCIKAIETWQKKGVPWISHFAQILEAERAWVEGQPEEEVKKAFDAAIRLSARTGFPNNCALANERCAIYFEEQGDTGWSRFYMEKAITLYQEWGAMAKVDLLMITRTLGLGGEQSGSASASALSRGSRSSGGGSTLRGRERFTSRYGGSDSVISNSMSMSDILRRSTLLGNSSGALE